MAASYGQMQEFCPEDESIEAYLERIELYFTANNIAEERQVAVLLSVIGGKTYTLLRNLLAPVKPSTKTLAQLKEVLKKHFEPKRVVIAERFRFYRREQAVGESVATYEAELRRLAAHCEFGDYLDQALRDRLVCGLKSESTQKHLLSKADLTLKRALEIAQSQEAAERHAMQLKGDVGVGTMNVEKVSDAPRKEKCRHCGRGNHLAQDCRFREAQCFRCGRNGHIATVCRARGPPSKGKSPGSRRQQSAKWVHAAEDSDSSGDTPEESLVCKVKSGDTSPITVELLLNGSPLTMEVDTGAAVSIISEQRLKQVLPRAKLQKTTVKLRTYTGEAMSVLGEFAAEVAYRGTTHVLPLYVVQGGGPTLLGRSWLQCIRLDWKSLGIGSIEKMPTPVDELLQKYAAVFQEGLGTMHHFKASLHLTPNALPRFHRPRSVPFALRDAVGRELDKMEEMGVLERVSHSKWAAPIVSVPKKDGHIRICGDFKVTVNPVLQVDQYPLPKPEDIFATLAGGQKFTKLDLKQAYQQMVLEDDAKELVTINTHQGLYRFTRLPYGIASAPALFQRTMDTILRGIPGVLCYIDDILITGKSTEEHMANLEEVLLRLRHQGIVLKATKCAFFQDAVEYLGHTVDIEGLHTTPQKVEAVKLAPTPKNQQQLRSFLGVVHYYGKFLPNLASILHPLNQLLKAGTRWRWTPECENALNVVKDKLCQAPILAHFDPTLPIRLAGDASSTGVGAVISHLYPDGTERPIAYASRTLTTSERNYSQLEREALSLVFGIKRFHQFLYGREFELLTDHKPLTTILGPKTGVPPLAAARLQRWALLLSAYRYTIKYKATKAHGNADGLSRLPMESASSSDTSPTATVFNIHQIAALPVTSRQIAEATRRHPILSRVLHNVKHGWSNFNTDPTMQPYWSRRHELTTEQGCILWGIRVVVPRMYQQQVLEELHQAHPGIVRMKAVARSYVWWPLLNADIEALAKSCQKCQSNRSMPQVAPLHPWLWPTQPWQRVHIDYAGPVEGKMLLIVVDAHSKWPEVVSMGSTTSLATIQALRRMFASYGIPRQLVSDNGPQFSSLEFTTFLARNGVKHILTAPYHPSSNGQAERFVRTLKQGLKNSDLKDFHIKLANFLLSYRSTPHSTTNTTPSELFLGRSLRTRLDLLRPDLGEHVSKKQGEQKKSHDHHAKGREFFIGQRVLTRNLRRGPRWVLGTVIERKGPLTYLVQVIGGAIWKRHVDHLLQSSDSPQEEGESIAPDSSESLPEVPQPTQSNLPAAMNGTEPSVSDVPQGPDTVELPNEPSTAVGPTTDTNKPTEVSSQTPEAPNPTRRYPERIRNPPQRYHELYS